MNSKTNLTALKILSFALSFMIVLSVIPMKGMVAFAADDYFCIQYLENGKVQKNVALALKTDENADSSYEGRYKGIYYIFIRTTSMIQSFHCHTTC